MQDVDAEYPLLLKLNKQNPIRFSLCTCFTMIKIGKEPPKNENILKHVKKYLLRPPKRLKHM